MSLKNAYAEEQVVVWIAAVPFRQTTDKDKKSKTTWTE